METDARQNGCSARRATTPAWASTAKESKKIRYVLVCDDCGEEVQEILDEPYVAGPGARPAGRLERRR